MLTAMWNCLQRAPPRGTYRQLADRCLARFVVPSAGALPSPRKPRVGVVVTPWQQTAVPFYLVEWAARLRRDGMQVEFIWDVWPNLTGQPTDEEKIVFGVLRDISQRFQIPIVTPVTQGKFRKDLTMRLECLAFEAVTRDLRREPFWDDPAVRAEAERLREHAGRVEAFLGARGYAWILVPGGVWAVSGVYWEAAMAQSIGLTTFDSGAGLLCFQHGGPAAHFPDLATSMRTLTESCSSSPTLRRRVETWVNNRLEVRRRGEDEFQLQPVGSQLPAGPAHVVVPLNYRLDTAAMCRQRLFRSVNDWIRALVDWAVARPNVVIAFRQHPCEKIPAYRSAEDYTWIPAAGPNIRLIAAEDPINTYDLLRACKVVLPYSSRVGIEAAIFGKSVVLAASAYYESMPFASVPASRDAYFARIEELLASTRQQTDRERCSAYAAYFVAENYGLHRTHFTPMPVDFEIWSSFSPDELWAQDQHGVFLRALVERRPAAELLLEQQFAAWETKPAGSQPAKTS